MANFENIKLDKGLYRTKKGFLAELESVDPSENYKGTSLEGLDAFERQLKRFDIKINGKNSSTIDKFFQTTDSAVLFPEYVTRTIRESIAQANNLDDIVAAKTNIEGLDYRSIALTPSKDDLELKYVNEGAFIPETEIKTQENHIKLHKRGRAIVASYESLRFQRLDVFNVMLRQIGMAISQNLFEDAINTLIMGDGNNNAIDKTVAGKALTVDDLTKAVVSLYPYDATTIITSPEFASKVCLSELFAGKDKNFATNGTYETPFGAKIVSYRRPKDYIIALNKNFALEMVTAGDIMVDSDRLIDRQLERTAITQIAGFAKISKEASKMVEA